MKTKRNYPRRTMVKFGKCYFDYVKIELEKGNLTVREFRSIKKCIPSNA